MKRVKYKKFIFLCIFILILNVLLAGCAFKDIDKRSFVVGIGIDPAENDNGKYKVTLKIALPIGSIKQATGPSYAYLSHESNKISEAIRNMETRSDKVLEFGHTKFIAISKDLVGKEFQGFMDYFIRRGDVQLVTWVAATSPSAEDILKVQPKTEAPSSIALFNTFDGNGTDSPYIITTHLFELRRDYWNNGIEPVLPLITTNEKQTELITNKSLVIKKDENPLQLNTPETLYYNTLVHHAKGYSYKILGEDLELFLNIQKVKVNYKIHVNSSKAPSITFKVKVVGTVLESSKELDTAKLDDYNKIASKDMKKVTEKLLLKVQKENMDPFGFGLRYRATRLNQKNTFSDWEKVYPTIKFDVHFDVDLQSIGAIK